MFDRNSFTRDGRYEANCRFVVFEQEDLKNIITLLSKCLTGGKNGKGQT